MSLNSTIRGVQFTGSLYGIEVANIPAPVIINQTDAIVRITAAGICGSDLHNYRGVAGAGPTPYTIGHEAIGVVSQIGDAVTGVAPGDYVVISDTIGNGHLHLNTENEGDTYFGGGEGTDGLQAEYARVPVADQNLIPVPLTRNTTSRSKEQDYLTVGDIFSTGWQGISWSGFEPGDTVAVFGAGPVGLLAAHAAIIRGASRVYIVDHVQDRLNLGKSIGAIPINFIDSDPVQQILRHEPDGVKRSVDAVGFEALNSDLQYEEGILIRQLVDVTQYNGGVGVVGVYGSTPGAILPDGAPIISPNITFPVNTFWAKGISIRGGSVDPRQLAPELVRLIASGKARPSFITSAEITIDQAPEYYRRFNRTEETKVFIHFD